ncbi:hypothetical protein R5R35_004198 [Gryllus longicercus]|uniref:Methylenetetrahydrofolate reductase (NAD(P)H) n=1 Tax=Gryllus longicercus TaxID=2509291 RepID=A0AAN9YZU3_9ORTH
MDFEQRNLVTNLLEVIKGGGIPVSIEISPPESQTETQRLLLRIDGIYARCHLQFCAVTWHLRNFSNTHGINFKAIQFAHNLQIRNKEVLLHVAAKRLNRENVLQILKELQSLKINNIFALRGDDVGTISQDYFLYAEQLVRFIREKTGEEMVICVAGYPNGHPEGESYRSDLIYLREKVKAGANFIITQIILEAETFNCFVRDCQDLGINVPILAGIMPIQDYNSFKRMSNICHLEIPKHIETTLQSIQENPETVKNFGIFHAVMTVKGILSARNSLCGLHFFTMNR